MSSRGWLRGLWALVLAGSLALLWAHAPLRAQEGDPSPATLSGVVQNEDGEPIAGATVRVQTRAFATQTDAAGHFTLSGLPPDRPLTLTAWAPGYYIGGGGEEHTYSPNTDGIVLTLEAYPEADNAAYAWVSAYAEAGEKSNCQNCHAATDPTQTQLPFDQWQQDAHAQSAHNPRFLTMYTGTDIHGNASPPTRYTYNRDYGRRPLPPDLGQPYYGPGYKLDFPAAAGNCAACHVPAAAVNAPYGTDPTHVEGVGAEGVACDLCHKVQGVYLEPESGLPYPNMPGVLSLEFRRPPEETQFFAGPLDDVAPGEDTYVSLQTQSQFCAACHYGIFWDTLVYNSFGEWLASPYSDPESGQTCQDCHMPTFGATHFVRPDRGGLERDPATIVSHKMLGAQDVDLLQATADLSLEAAREDDALRVHVQVTNSGAGHHIPTDSPLRQIFLIVTATDANGQPLTLAEGPTLPDWAGDLEGVPGVYFAKILEEVWTEVSPSGAYWNPTRVLEDTRLAALETRSAEFTFALTESAAAPVRVEARLIYRRAFYDLMQQKGWDVPDILMEQAQVSVP